MSRLAICSSVSGGFVDIESYLIGLSEALPKLGPVTMDINITIEDEQKEYTSEEAKEIKNNLIHEISSILKESGSASVNDPENLWYQLRYIRIEKSDYWNTIVYKFVLKKVS